METFNDFIDISLIITFIMFIVYIGIITLIEVLIGVYTSEAFKRSLIGFKMIIVRLFK